MTPGRETDEDIIEIEEEEYNITLENQDYDEIAIVLIEALGGEIMCSLQIAVLHDYVWN